jgi:hypothetical protein
VDTVERKKGQRKEAESFWSIDIRYNRWMKVVADVVPSGFDCWDVQGDGAKEKIQRSLCWLCKPQVLLRLQTKGCL